MTLKNYQLTGVGNAIVDIIARKDDAFLVAHNIKKGVMQLVEKSQSRALINAIGDEGITKKSGGSAANTTALFAALGGHTAYIGKINKDKFGYFFCKDIQSVGVHFESPKIVLDEQNDTGNSIIIVTPDGERSMNTYLGASETLRADDINPQLLKQSEWVYLEGYRFDGEESHMAFAKALKICHEAGTKVALTLSDPFCVKRHHRDFSQMIVNDVNLLFCNYAEILALWGGNDFKMARQKIAQHVDILACTDGANGAYILSKGKEWHANAEKISVVDTTGAGDAFAAGVLFGLSQSYALAHCAKIGCALAGHIIGEIGARSEKDLRALLVQKRLINPNMPQ